MLFALGKIYGQLFLFVLRIKEIPLTKVPRCNKSKFDDFVQNFGVCKKCFALAKVFSLFHVFVFLFQVIVLTCTFFEMSPISSDFLALELEMLHFVGNHFYLYCSFFIYNVAVVE